MVVLTERPGSFGLHSPDRVPQTAEELAQLTIQYKQLRQVQERARLEHERREQEKLNPTYNPKLFCDGGLYLDPDIIGKSRMMAHRSRVPLYCYCQLFVVEIDICLTKQT